MSQGKNSFRHESLQDSLSIQELLKAISKGIARGRVSFSDEDGEILMEPDGLLQVKVTARKEDVRHRIDLRITWEPDEKVRQRGKLHVNGSGKA